MSCTFGILPGWLTRHVSEVKRTSPRPARFRLLSPGFPPRSSYGISFRLPVFLTMKMPSLMLVITTAPLSKYG